MKFIKIRYNDVDIQERILIQNAEDLFEYAEKVQSAKIAGAFENLISSDENKEYKGKHNLAEFLMFEYKNSGMNLISTSKNLEHKLLESKLKALNHGSIIVNCAGGYCFLEGNQIVGEVYENEFVPIEYLTSNIF